MDYFRQSLAQLLRLINEFCIEAEYCHAISICQLFIVIKSGKIGPSKFKEGIKGEYIFEPNLDYEKLNQGFHYMDVPTDVIIFLNYMNKIWKYLSYGPDKKSKKNWRLFKNSSIITLHAKNAFDKIQIYS